MSIETPSRDSLTLVTNGSPHDHQDALDEGRKLAMEAMRHLADGQLDRAERVRLSARQAFVYVSGFFAVAQVVTFSAFANANIANGEQDWIVRMALGAAISVAITGILAIWTDKLRSVPDPTPKDIADAIDEAEAEGTPAADALTQLYASVVKNRSKAVKDRGAWIKATTAFAMVTVAVTLAEIVLSLLYRLP
jgi:hypothetical protein